MAEGFIAEHFEANREVVARSAEALRGPAEAVARALVEALGAGHKVGACGSGGSAAQASHLVGELLGRFKMTRQPFPAIALASDAGTVTCIANDFGYAELFERQVEALAQEGDICFGFTTSGRSENVRRGLVKARERGAVTVAVTGSAGVVRGGGGSGVGRAGGRCDVMFEGKERGRGKEPPPPPLSRVRVLTCAGRASVPALQALALLA